MTAHDDDAADVERARAGDGEAFARLVARHAPRVHDVARRMLRDAHEAEDVAQQAFWNAWRALARFDTSRPFSHWILRIATNLCRNRWAARGRRREASGMDAPEAAARASEPHVAERVGDPDLRAAIERLPEAYRLAIVLKYVHGLSLEEIAEITGHPVATVKTHLHRGRAALRDLLEGETPPRGRGTTEEPQ